MMHYSLLVANVALSLLTLPFSASGFVGGGLMASTQHVLSPLESSAQDLLYQDQQEAMLRQAIHEQELLRRKKPIELKAPKIKPGAAKAGTGFGGAKVNPKAQIAEQQAKILHRDGVLRINGALSEDAADKLREYVLEQQVIAARETERDPSLSQAYYGVENARKNRCDLQLSLLRGGYAAGDGKEFESHPLADTLQELLGSNGSLRQVYETLVTPRGELYELATVITDPGSIQQTVHADLPFKPIAPIYVIFLALQDVNEHMGPTSFLVGTHTPEGDAMFNSDQKDEQLMKADCRLATLKKGDCVLFDARTLHAGNANDPEKGQTRALFNFSFRNGQVTGNLGYDGSIMPGYVKAISLSDISEALEAYKYGAMDPFAKFGNGLE
jgi:ectoine hydroxylase-related dioxygenase (phytanoyl-CoA dioxygenase family)